jgi:hypothetical protein
MARQSDYALLVAQAEQAVKAVKDPELKRVAFEKVLDDLLTGGAASKASAKQTAAPAKKSATKIAKRRARGPAGYLQELVDDGFFKKQKTIAQVKAELENRGHHIPLTSLSGPLQNLCKRRVLRRQKKKTSGKKQTFSYSEW